MLKSGNLEVQGRKIKHQGSDTIDFTKEYRFDPMFDLDKYIFIPGRVYSSKNSEQIRIKISSTPTKWKCNTKTKGWLYVRPFVAKNDNAQNYKKRTAHLYKIAQRQFKDMSEGKKYPLIVEFIFVMPDKTEWDWNNITQLVQDCMVDGGMIPDDNVYVMLPTFPREQAFYIDKTAPGVYFRVV